MARRYSVNGTDTTTANTTQIGVAVANTGVRGRIYDFLVGSVATPADNAAEFYIARFTASGTATGMVPVALDPADPSALSTGLVNNSAEPTYTAGANLLKFAHNQRATFRWVAAPQSELVIPNTLNNGIGVLANAVGGAAVAETYTILFEE